MLPIRLYLSEVTSISLSKPTLCLLLLPLDFLLCHALRRDTVLGTALSEAAITARLPYIALICPTPPNSTLPSWFHPGRFLTTVYWQRFTDNGFFFDLTSALADMIDVFLFDSDLSLSPCNLLLLMTDVFHKHSLLAIHHTHPTYSSVQLELQHYSESTPQQGQGHFSRPVEGYTATT